jgi:hypothetical protein
VISVASIATNEDNQHFVFAWVNDDDTKRAYGSNDDAHRVFRKMLEGGQSGEVASHGDPH